MPQPGEHFGNYLVERVLGTGGFAEVYEAVDPLLQRKVALKVLLPEFARTTDMVARFQREVRAVAGLSHPGIVQIYTVGNVEGLDYYAMQLLPGGDLRKRMQEKLPPYRAMEIIATMADALAQAHAQDIIHRDIKPENILFDDADNPVLTDFGIAKVLNAQNQLTAAGTAMGTPRYLSPEQARGSTVDARADIYSLGIILFEMLAGRPPFDGPDPVSIVLKHATEPVPKLPPEHAAQQALIDQLLAKHPGQRPASAAELCKLAQRQARHLKPADAGPTPVIALSPAPPPVAQREPAPQPAPTSAPNKPTDETGKPRRRVWIAIGLVLLVAAIALGGFMLSRTSGSTPQAAPEIDAGPDNPATVDAVPETPAATAPTESRAARVVREKKRCALHVSALTGSGDLVYDDAIRFPGARQEADGTGIWVPRIQLGNGQWVNALVTPEGCVLIKSLAAGPAK
ncbi:MAG: protein kinase [Pseudomonadota bacterium]|nr:protein kinase [Pseudomonadota bacterium]